MALILPHSVCFHIPKTGGTWVRRVLQKENMVIAETCVLGRNARATAQMAHETPDMLPAYLLRNRKTFAFVRHPLTWYQSRWKWKARMRNRWNREENKLDKECGSDDFNEFILQYLHKFPGYLTRMYKRFLGEDGKRLSYVGRFESLPEDLFKIITTFEGEIDKQHLLSFPPVNVSFHCENDASYRSDLKKALLKEEEWILRTFGYEEEPPPHPLETDFIRKLTSFIQPLKSWKRLIQKV